MRGADDAAHMKREDRTFVRTLFLSDIHLGMRSCRAEDLAEFLRHIRCEHIYLVGDIIDLWQLRRKWHWSDAQTLVVRRLLKQVSRGTKITFVPGNHDEGVRRYVGMDFGGIHIAPHATHALLDGRKLLVTHGDQFDLVVQHAPWLSALGNVAYDWLVETNRRYNGLRRAMGLAEVSLSQQIKGKVKKACTYISRFEDALVQQARDAGLHGVVCGHIHKAELRTDAGGFVYANCGDWIESSTALVETLDGRLELIQVRDFLAAQAVTAASGEDEIPEHPTDPVALFEKFGVGMMAGV